MENQMVLQQFGLTMDKKATANMGLAKVGL